MFTPSDGRALIAILHQGKIIAAGTLMDFIAQERAEAGYYRANIGIWIEPQYRGVNSHHISFQLVTFCHTALTIENLFAMTPWRSAKELCLRTGMQNVGEIPGYTLHKGRPMDVEIFQSEIEFHKHNHLRVLLDMGYLDNTARKMIDEAYGRGSNDG